MTAGADAAGWAAVAVLVFAATVWVDGLVLVVVVVDPVAQPLSATMHDATTMVVLHERRRLGWSRVGLAMMGTVVLVSVGDL